MVAVGTQVQDWGFLQGGGEAGEHMRAVDWSRTPLGEPDGWPQCLRTAVRIMLDSRHAMWIAWGEGLPFLYNDAYVPTLGAKHSHAMGRPTREVWAEVWDFIESRLPTVMAGEATWDEGLLLFLERNGFPEETYHSFSYSPLRDGGGAVRGLLCVVTEETERHVAVRHTAVLRELAVHMNGARSLDAVATAAVQALAEDPHDLPYVGLYRVDADAGLARRVAVGRLDGAHPALPTHVRLAADDSWPIGQSVRERGLVVVDDLVARFGPQPEGPWGQRPTHGAVVPIELGDAAAPSAALVVALSPHRRFDPTYRGFLELAAGQIGGAMGIAHAHEDARRRADELLELDRAKTAFFSNVSHEFRTPLTLMLGPLEDLREDAGVPAPVAGTLKVVHRNALRLQRMVNTLLDFSRVEAGRAHAQPVATDLGPLTANLASTFRAACERAGLALEVDCPPLPRAARVDRGMWETIVLNLLSNAFKHTLAGRIGVRTWIEGEVAYLEVVDSGSGIPESELPYVFDRFHRVAGTRGRSQEGSGIGLALVEELVRLHGGTVDVRSVVGQGSTFRVGVPLEAAGITVSEAPSQPANADAFLAEAMRWLPDDEDGSDAQGEGPDAGDLDAARPRVLVVDDNADLRDYLRKLLRDDYRVETVADGQAALDAARARPPALVLSDVMMSGLDGFGLLAALRADPATQAVPVILLSARAGEEARIEGLRSGADDYIVKPFAARELLARVAAAVAAAAVRRVALRRELALERERVDVLETIGDAFIALDADWTIRYVNAALERTVEGSRATVVGRRHWDAFPADAADAPYAEILRTVMRSRRAQRVQHYYAPVQQWFEVDIVPAQSGGLHIYGRDISAQRMRFDALRESERLLREMADEAPAMLWITDAAGQLTFLSKAWYDYTGHEADGALGNGWIDDLHPDQREQVVQVFMDANARQVEFTQEHLLLSRQGGYRWVHVTGRPRRDPQGRFLGYIGTLLDIDELRKASDALRESESRYRFLFDSIDEGFCVLEVLRDADGDPFDFRYVEANPSFETQAGLVDVVGRTVGELLPGDWRDWARRYAHVEETGESIRLEGPAPVQGRWYDVYAFRVMHQDKPRVAVLFTDTTQRRRDEGALRDADRRKDEFLATLAHELRNPLAPISSALQLLAGNVDAALADHLHAIMRRQTVQLTRLVDDLMEVSRITRGRIDLQRAQVDVRDTVRDALDASAEAVRAGGHRVEVDLPDEALVMEADTVRLSQVFTNLLNNAARHTDAGGLVRVRAWRCDGAICVSVADTGHGIRPGDRARIFELFAQVAPAGASKGGLGIGLTLARRLVEMHGGTIDVDSEGPGRGSTFTVRLPALDAGVASAAPDAPASTPVPVPAAGPLSGLRVVVADDNHDAAATLAMWLQMQGAQATQAHDGMDALEAIARIDAHAALLDLGMPRGGGIEVAKQVRARADVRQPVLVAVTGWGQAVDRERTREAGFDHHLTKPADLDALHALLAPVAARARAGV